MKNCSVKTYKASVDNADLLKPGEIRFKGLVNNASILLRFSDNVQQNVVAVSGTITSQNWSNNTLTVTIPKDTVISVPDKYKLKMVNTSNMTIVGHDIESLLYSPITDGFVFDGAFGSYSDDEKIIGDITKLCGKMTSLKNFNLRSQKVSGSIDALVSNSVMTNLLLQGDSDIVGTVSSIASAAITEIAIENTGITGNLSDLGSKPALKKLFIPVGVSGNLSDLSGLSALENFMGTGDYSGDLSQIPATVVSFVSTNSGTFSWTSRAASSKIFSIGRNSNFVGNGINLGNDLDTFLGNVVNCTMPSLAVKINVIGTESASTASLASALKTKISAVSGSFLIINGRTI